MKIRTFGLATVAALLISQFAAPLPSNSTVTSSYTLDQATFSLTQTNSILAFEIDDKDSLAIDRILIDGFELTSDENGVYEYEMGQRLEVEVVLSSDSASSLDKSDPMRHIASRTFPVKNLASADTAIAQSTNATRTRIRYQTFIGRDFVEANLICLGFYGINFDLHFYVRRDGVYTLTGNYLPVPFHEVYARDNSDPSWRQITRSGFEFFECFTPIIGNLCDVNNLSQRSAF